MSSAAPSGEASIAGVTLDGAALPPPDDGRLWLERSGDEAVLVAEAEVAYSLDGRGLSRFTDPADDAPNSSSSAGAAASYSPNWNSRGVTDSGPR